MRNNLTSKNPFSRMSYQVIQEYLQLPGLSLQIERVGDIDSLFNDFLERNAENREVKDEQIPYWADLWPSAIAMAEYLLRENSIRPGTKIFEVGCGLGLPGIVAGKMGADVTFSDYLPDALEFAKRNWYLNHPVKEATFLQMDWRIPNISETTEIILASDVAYETRSFDELITAFTAWTQQGRTILLSEPCRKLAKPFYRQMELMKLEINKTEQTVVRNGITTWVNVCKISKKQLK